MNHRRSTRLRDFDYSQDGAYFVTICTWNRACVFGDIVQQEMQLNEDGRIVYREWQRTSQVRNNIKIDSFIVMPNHLHGIVIIDHGNGTLYSHQGRGTLQRAPTREGFGKPVSGSLPTIIRLFKSTTTKQINLSRHTLGIHVWQRNYYEHVIRNEKELTETREYIINNPLRWDLDKENLNKIKTDDDRRGEVSSPV